VRLKPHLKRDRAVTKKENIKMSDDNLSDNFTWKEKLKNIVTGKLFIYSVSSLLVLVGLFFVSIFAIDHWKGRPVGDGSAKYDLEIHSGDGSISVTKDLHRNGMIRSKAYFQFLLKVSKNSQKIKQGVYNVHDGMNARTIIDLIVSGKVKMRHFTVPEGYNNRQIGSLLASKKLVESKEQFLKIADDPELLKKFHIPAKTSEGYLYPDTYSIPYHYGAKEIVEMMIKSFFKNLSKIEKAKDNTPAEIHKKVILASIVEREAQRPKERPLMAGVFKNRIEKGIKLESCATVQYLFEKPKKRLLEIHLKQESPYNTYLHYGYPPGAISNPGLPALKAAYDPVISDNLFFLLKPDGSHYFSKSLKEHLEAKKKYIDVLYK
jgi:UPF0755 protein